MVKENLKDKIKHDIKLPPYFLEVCSYLVSNFHQWVE